jgi:hypothetical protein
MPTCLYSHLYSLSFFLSLSSPQLHVSYILLCLEVGPNVLEESERNAPPKLLVRHAHVHDAVIHDVVENVAIIPEERVYKESKGKKERECVCV